MSWPQRSGPRGTGGNRPHAVHTGGQRGKLQLASDLLGACVHNPRSRKKRSPGETLPEGGEEEQRMGPDPALSSRCPQTAAHNAVLLLFTQLHLHRHQAPPSPESHPSTGEAHPPNSSHCLEPGLRGPLPVPPPPYLCPQALALLSLTAAAPGFILCLSSPRGSKGCVSWESLR